MSWGFSGPSSSGKTTLARAVSKITGAPFLEFKTTELVAELGLSPVAELGLEDRFKVQSHLLERFWQLSQAAPRPYVSDRTPLDFLTYMLAEVSMHNTSPAFGKQIVDFTDRCVSMADRSFLAIFTLRSLPLYEVDPKRPPPNVGYHRHYELILEGSLMRLAHATSYSLFACSHEDRLKSVSDCIRTLMVEVQKQRAASYSC